jgi:hypothetical protein
MDMLESLTLEATYQDDFMECDTCRKKPGMTRLCDGCLHNRSLISNIKKELFYKTVAIALYEELCPEYKAAVVKLASKRAK